VNVFLVKRVTELGHLNVWITTTLQACLEMSYVMLAISEENKFNLKIFYILYNI
tara:strand:- start:509 stop:670 length:162 start_codon:yes stop_codon:yes gene_type:complete